MKIGFLNAALMHWSPEQLLAFAGEHHFDAVELHAGPGSWDVIWSQAAHGDISRIRRLLERYNLECAGLMYGQLPFLSIDPKERDNAQRYLLMLLNVAHALGIPVVSTFAGRRLGENWAGNVAIFQEVFTPLVATAERLGVKIGLENCPMTHGFEPITNIAYAPAVWDLLFEAVPSRALGLTLDPSHLAWLGIDRAMGVYGEKIIHVHAKDTEIFPDRVQHESILGEGWWRYRLPGLGSIDWNTFLGALESIKYVGVVSIEHEDPEWSGTDDRVIAGLLTARDFLLTQR